VNRLPRNFGWDRVRLSEHSLDDLARLRRSVEDDPASANPDHAAGRSVFLYTPAARRKLDALAWAVTHRLRENAKK
jgi:hypothetical protein